MLLPGVVSGLAIFLGLVFLAYEVVLDARGQSQVWMWLGFIPARLVQSGIPGDMWPLIWTPVTHAFLHGSWTHLIMNVIWLAIFGTPVAYRYGTSGFFIAFLAGAIGGAIFYGALQLDSFSVLIGASGGVAGLTGAAMRFVFEPVIVRHDPETGEVVAAGRRLADFFRVWANVRSRTFILLWMGLNLAIPVWGAFSESGGLTIAWQAHIGGFVAGFVLPGILEKGKRKTV